MIAVVIPCRNLGRTVEEAIASVRAQTLPAAEIVVVDDGSDDALTQAVLARIERETRVIRAPHRGVAAARNTGVRATTAPLVVALDADDRLDPTYLAKTAAALDDSLAFVTTGMHAFEGADWRWMPAEPTFSNILLGRAPHATTLFRRSLWDALGGFDETLSTCEDQDFWARAVLSGARGAVVKEHLLRYRVRGDSLHHGSLSRGSHTATVQALFRRHREAVEREGLPLLLARERVTTELKQYGEKLRAEHARRVAELADLRRQVDEERAAIRALGADPLDFGDLRRTRPFSEFWGLERGKPLDRFYVERFLDAHRADIGGSVLEVKDAGYTRLFGRNVTESGVIDVDPGNPDATLVGDLTRAETLPDGRFDCFILTQTLHIIADVERAIAGAAQVLKPGGVLLATLPALGRVNLENGGLDRGDYWRFTEASVRKLFSAVFPAESLEVTTHGNALAGSAFLMGLSPDELREEELLDTDLWHPVLFTVRARKALEKRPRRNGRAAVLLYHRIGRVTPDPDRLCVTPEHFRTHLDVLRRHARPMPLEELVERVSAGNVPDRAIAVTFDDGYLDALTNASPLLLEAGVPATFFVNRTDGAEFWWDTLTHVLLEHDPPATLDIAGRTFRTHDAESRRAAREALAVVLREASVVVRDDMLRHLLTWSGTEAPRRDERRPMTAPEVLELAARRGHAIGIHTPSHLWLLAQPVDVRKREISGGIRDLTVLLGTTPPVLAYPYGAFDGDLAAQARALGVRYAVTVEGGLVPETPDLLAIPRTEPGDLEEEAFADWLERLFQRGPSEISAPGSS